MLVPEKVTVYLKKEDVPLLHEILIKLEYVSRKRKAEIYSMIFGVGLYTVREKLEKIMEQETNGKKRKKSNK